MTRKPTSLVATHQTKVNGVVKVVIRPLALKWSGHTVDVLESVVEVVILPMILYMVELNLLGVVSIMIFVYALEIDSEITYHQIIPSIETVMMSLPLQLRTNYLLQTALGKAHRMVLMRIRSLPGRHVNVGEKVRHVVMHAAFVVTDIGRVYSASTIVRSNDPVEL